MGTVSVVTNGALFERERERQTLDASLRRAVAGRGGVVVVEGPRGIGVTALLEALLASAADGGVRVARVHAEGDGAAGGWPGALVLVDPRGARRRLDVDDDGPLLLVVDDADHATLALAPQILRWVRGRRVLFAAGVRTAAVRSAGGPSPSVLAGNATIVRPRPLSGAGAGALLAREAGVPLAPEAVAVALRVTGGTPALLVALAAALLEAGVDPGAHPDDGLRDVADRVVARAVRDRIPSAAAVDVAEVAALLDRWASPRAVAQLLRRPASAVHPLLDDLVASGLLARAHPPTYARRFERDAIVRSTGLVRAQQLRADGALLLAGTGQPLGAGMLLLDVDPCADARRAEILRAAAASALDGERPDLAIELLERRLAEPVAAADRASTLVALGTTQVRVGLAAGTDTLRGALNEASDPADVADAAAALGWALAGGAQGEDAARALMQARARVHAAGGAGLGVALDVQIADMAGWDAALRPARRAAVGRLARAAGSPLAAAATIAAQALDATAACEPADTVAQLSQAALADGVLADTPRGVPTALSTAMLLAYAGRPRPAIDHIDHTIARLRANDMPELIRPATAFRGAMKLMLGRLAEAEADLRSIVDAPWLVRSTPLAVGFLVTCLVERGDDDGAAQLLADLDLEGGDLQELIPHAPFLQARGELRALRGDPHAALDDLRACGRRLMAGDWRNPTVAPWRSSAARLLMQLGRDDEARVLAAEELRLAERFGAPAVLCRALRAQAATLAPAQARPLLQRATALTSDAQTPVEHVAALVDLAAAEIAAGSPAQARPHLHAALALAHDIGAERSARRAAELMPAAGGRVRRADRAGLSVLTSAEQRVAQLAAAGRTNQEISAELVVSRKTVETHLRSVFRKLGIRSRAQLPEMLARGASDAA